jgi:predicted ATPase
VSPADGTWSGGIGKTRLALQAAEQQLPAFAHGVYFVSLAPISAPESIATAIAAAIRFTFYAGSEPRKQLLDYVRHKQMLLLVDNFEHVLAGAGLLADILLNAPVVKILVTSRERLNLQGEALFALDGMGYPTKVFAEDAARYSAVRLFLHSAAQVQPNFSVTLENLHAAVRICQLVQGMPLGILLAAAWVNALSVQEIARQIQNSLDFLETDQRDLPERQRSLRAAFNHSWGC